MAFRVGLASELACRPFHLVLNVSPGSFTGVAGVVLEWELDRTALAVSGDPTGARIFSASGYPRPIPGVPPERNLSGISFAVANVTGFLARVVLDRGALDRL
jgi:hypothetical protein